MIPKLEWKDITHIFVTHGDPDHYWHTDRVAKISNALVICNKTMVKKIDGNTLMLAPRNRGLSFTAPIKRLQTISIDETIQRMKPKFVIPCHYNCPAFFSKKYNPADDKMFKEEVEKTGIKCEILYYGDSIDI